jgi:vacuolar protein sorting-associated protein 13A/C
VEELVFENERYLPLRGWSPSNLLATERRRYSRAGQSYSIFPNVPLPPGWEWEGPWHMDTSGEAAWCAD